VEEGGSVHFVNLLPSYFAMHSGADPREGDRRAASEGDIEGYDSDPNRSNVVFRDSWDGRKKHGSMAVGQLNSGFDIKFFLV
jgi:hypothetical protein